MSIVRLLSPTAAVKLSPSQNASPAPEAMAVCAANGRRRMRIVSDMASVRRETVRSSAE